MFAGQYLIRKFLLLDKVDTIYSGLYNCFLFRKITSATKHCFIPQKPSLCLSASVSPSLGKHPRPSAIPGKDFQGAWSWLFIPCTRGPSSGLGSLVQRQGSPVQTAFSLTSGSPQSNAKFPSAACGSRCRPGRGTALGLSSQDGQPGGPGNGENVGHSTPESRWFPGTLFLSSR